MELTTALFVLAVGVSASILVFYRATETLKAHNERRIAYRIVENELESLRALDGESLLARHGQGFTTDAPEIEKLVSAQPEIIITPDPASGGRLIQAAVTLRWRTQNGRLATASLTALIRPRTVEQAS